MSDQLLDQRKKGLEEAFFVKHNRDLVDKLRRKTDELSRRQELISIYGSGTPRAFGHLGFTNIVTYADPERDIAVALLTSGKPFLHTGLARWLDVMRTIARVCPRTREVARRYSGGRSKAKPPQTNGRRR